MSGSASWNLLLILAFVGVGALGLQGFRFTRETGAFAFLVLDPDS